MFVEFLNDWSCVEDEEKIKTINYKPKKGNAIIYRYSTRYGDYIGYTTKSIKERAGKNMSGYLQNDYSKWSLALREAVWVADCGIEILEEVPLNQVDEREKFWIAHFNSWQKGFNSTPGGKGKWNGDSGDIRGIEVSFPEMIAKMSDTQKSAAIFLLSHFFETTTNIENKTAEQAIIDLIKELANKRICYCYYAFEGDYEDKWMTIPMFIYNFDLLFAAEGICDAYNNSEVGYSLHDCVNDYCMYNECYGGDPCFENEHYYRFIYE